jgi:antitoxin (DNA-binding transcriptional repressor) of toxin-antitoxin stability system
MTATDAARGFSDVLNRVAAGEEIDVNPRRGSGCSDRPPPSARLMSAERFRELIATAPPPDDRFATELRELRDKVAAPEPSWPS